MSTERVTTSLGELRRQSWLTRDTPHARTVPLDDEMSSSSEEEVDSPRRGQEPPSDDAKGLYRSRQRTRAPSRQRNTATAAHLRAALPKLSSYLPSSSSNDLRRFTSQLVHSYRQWARNEIAPNLDADAVLLASIPQHWGKHADVQAYLQEERLRVTQRHVPATLWKEYQETLVQEEAG